MEQGEARIDGIHQGGDGQIDHFIFPPDRIVVEDLDAVVIGNSPITPAITKAVGMRDEVDRMGMASRGHQGACVPSRAAGPGVVETEREEVAAGRGHLFAIDNREIGRIGGGHFGLRHREIVIGDGQKRKIRGMSGGDDFR